MNKPLLYAALGTGGLLAFTRYKTGAWNPLALFEHPPDSPQAPLLARVALRATAVSQAASSWVRDNAPAAAQPATTNTAAPQVLSNLQGDPVSVAQGGHYFVTVRTSGAATGMATADRIRSELANRGFTDVSVFKEMPDEWPGSVTGDWYVTGTYTRPDDVVQRHYGNFLGSVDLVDVWRVD